MANRLYIGNIPFKATEEMLRGFFSGIAEIVALDYITDARTGKPKGIAFVTMATEADAEKAIEALDGTPLLGRSLNVSIANTQEPRERRDLDRPKPRKRR